MSPSDSRFAAVISSSPISAPPLVGPMRQCKGVVVADQAVCASRLQRVRGPQSIGTVSMPRTAIWPRALAAVAISSALWSIDGLLGDVDEEVDVPCVALQSERVDEGGSNVGVALDFQALADDGPALLYLTQTKCRRHPNIAVRIVDQGAQGREGRCTTRPRQSHCSSRPNLRVLIRHEG